MESQGQSDPNKKSTSKNKTWIIAVVVFLVCCILAVAAVRLTVASRSRSQDSQQSQQSQEADSSKSSHSPEVTHNAEYEALQAVQHKPSKADAQGGFLVGKQGIGHPTENVPTVDIYMDFLCPPCGRLHRDMDSDLKTMVSAGQMNLGIHTMDFLNRLRNDEYSSRAASAVATVAELDPDHFIDLIASFYAEDFMPSQDSKQDMSNEQLAARIMSVGVPEKVARQAASGEYVEWSKKVNAYSKSRTDIAHKTGEYQGKVTTPTIVINGTYMNDANKDAGENYLENLLKSIGLDRKDVGVAGKLPSIGTGKPMMSK